MLSYIIKFLNQLLDLILIRKKLLQLFIRITKLLIIIMEDKP
jgi:hypothetical protein